MNVHIQPPPTSTIHKVAFGSRPSGLPPFPPKWQKILGDAYSQPVRKYHNKTHIEELLTLLKENVARAPEKIRDVESFELAIYFHDVVYDPSNLRQGGNEEASINLFRQFSDDQVPPAENDWKTTKTKVEELIRATILHEVPTHVVSEPFSQKNSDDNDNSISRTGGATTVDKSDLELFLDFDLSVLARDEKDYDVYVEQIREEYGFLTEEEFTYGRKMVLERFLGRGKLFYNEEFGNERDNVRRTREERARGNLVREVERLRGGRETLEDSDFAGRKECDG